MSLLARHGTVFTIPHDDITAGRVKAELEKAAVNPSLPQALETSVHTSGTNMQIPAVSFILA